MTTELSPSRPVEYSFGDIFIEGWRQFTRNFPALLIVFLCVYLPVNIILAFFPAAAFNLANLGRSLTSWYFLLPPLFGFLFGILASMAAALIVEQSLLGERISAWRALERAIPRWPSALATGLLVGVILLGLSLLLVVPGIFWGVSTVFWLYAVALRKQGIKAALVYSRGLVAPIGSGVKGRWWKVFGTWLVLNLLVLTAATLLGRLTGLLSPSPFLAILPNTLVSVLLALRDAMLVILFLNLEALRQPANLPAAEVMSAPAAPLGVSAPPLSPWAAPSTAPVLTPVVPPVEVTPPLPAPAPPAWAAPRLGRNYQATAGLALGIFTTLAFALLVLLPGSAVTWIGPAVVCTLAALVVSGLGLRASGPLAGEGRRPAAIGAVLGLLGLVTCAIVISSSSFGQAWQETLAYSNLFPPTTPQVVRIGDLQLSYPAGWRRVDPSQLDNCQGGPAECLLVLQSVNDPTSLIVQRVPLARAVTVDQLDQVSWREIQANAANLNLVLMENLRVGGQPAIRRTFNDQENGAQAQYIYIWLVRGLFAYQIQAYSPTPQFFQAHQAELKAIGESLTFIP